MRPLFSDRIFSALTHLPNFGPLRLTTELRAHLQCENVIDLYNAVRYSLFYCKARFACQNGLFLYRHRCFLFWKR